MSRLIFALGLAAALACESKPDATTGATTGSTSTSTSTSSSTGTTHAHTTSTGHDHPTTAASTTGAASTGSTTSSTTHDHGTTTGTTHHHDPSSTSSSSSSPGSTTEGGDNTCGGEWCSAKTAANIIIYDNHRDTPHILEVPSGDVEACLERTYDIQGEADHTHSVTFTPAHFTTIDMGGQVNIESTAAQGHTHLIWSDCE
jgi:hypothetical protein